MLTDPSSTTLRSTYPATLSVVHGIEQCIFIGNYDIFQRENACRFYEESLTITSARMERFWVLKWASPSLQKLAMKTPVWILWSRIGLFSQILGGQWPKHTSERGILHVRSVFRTLCGLVDRISVHFFIIIPKFISFLLLCSFVSVLFPSNCTSSTDICSWATHFNLGNS